MADTPPALDGARRELQRLTQEAKSCPCADHWSDECPAFKALLAFGADHGWDDLLDVILALCAALEAREADTRDAARWRAVERGLFIAAVDEETGEVEMVYQSGSMDEVAAELRPTLTNDPTAPVFNVAGVVVDEFIRRWPAMKLKRDARSSRRETTGQ